MLQANSCDKIEKFSEHLSGCADFIKGLPLETIDGIKTVFGVGKYDEQILKECGNPPKDKNIRRVKTKNDRSRLVAFRKKIKIYSICSKATERKYEKITKDTRDQIEDYRNQCRSNIKGRANKRRLARTGLPHIIRPCMKKLANANKCSKCLEIMNKVPIGIALIENTLNSFKKYKGFSCYNKKTQGEMVCAAIATAAGLPLAGATAARVLSLAGKLPKAFNKAKKLAQANKKKSLHKNPSELEIEIQKSLDDGDLQFVVEKTEGSATLYSNNHYAVKMKDPDTGETLRLDGSVVNVNKLSKQSRLNPNSIVYSLKTSPEVRRKVIQSMKEAKGKKSLSCLHGACKIVESADFKVPGFSGNPGLKIQPSEIARSFNERNLSLANGQKIKASDIKVFGSTDEVERFLTTSGRDKKKVLSEFSGTLIIMGEQYILIYLASQKGQGT